MTDLRRFFRRQRICEQHARAEAVPDGSGGLARFCQQCTRLEPLQAFYGRRRSCRASLARRQQRLADSKAAAPAHGWTAAAGAGGSSCSTHTNGSAAHGGGEERTSSASSGDRWLRPGTPSLSSCGPDVAESGPCAAGSGVPECSSGSSSGAAVHVPPSLLLALGMCDAWRPPQHCMPVRPATDAAAGRAAQVAARAAAAAALPLATIAKPCSVAAVDTAHGQPPPLPPQLQQQESGADAAAVAASADQPRSPDFALQCLVQAAMLATAEQPRLLL